MTQTGTPTTDVERVLAIVGPALRPTIVRTEQPAPGVVRIVFNHEMHARKALGKVIQADGFEPARFAERLTVVLSGDEA